MLSKKFIFLVYGIILGATWLFLLNYFFGSGDAIFNSSNSKMVKNSPAELRKDYLVDDEFITNNTYKGDPAVKAELVQRLSNFRKIQSFQAIDYSKAQTKGDIMPDNITPLEINFINTNGAQVQPEGYSSLTTFTEYKQGGKVLLKSYTGNKIGELYLDANYLASFLKKEENYKAFIKDLKDKGLTLNSYIKAEIIHGKRAFDGVEPNYFSAGAYAQKVRAELDSLNYEDIKKIDEYTYELINSSTRVLPLVSGDHVYYYKSILVFTSDRSFTLERKANEEPIMKISFNEDHPFPPIITPTGNLNQLNYNDEYTPGDKPSPVAKPVM
jgi:hypothetical protein